jgi:hypothetical protein
VAAQRAVAAAVAAAPLLELSSRSQR